MSSRALVAVVSSSLYLSEPVVVLVTNHVHAYALFLPACPFACTGSAVRKGRPFFRIHRFLGGPNTADGARSRPRPNRLPGAKKTSRPAFWAQPATIWIWREETDPGGPCWTFFENLDLWGDLAPVPLQAAGGSWQCDASVFLAVQALLLELGLPRSGDSPGLRATR